MSWDVYFIDDDKFHKANWYPHEKQPHASPSDLIKLNKTKINLLFIYYIIIFSYDDKQIGTTEIFHVDLR